MNRHSKISISLLLLSLILTACPGGNSAPAAGATIVGNAVCPVSDKPVGGSAKAPSFYSDFKGHRIGFMCPSCKGKFDAAKKQEQDRLLQKALESTRQQK